MNKISRNEKMGQGNWRKMERRGSKRRLKRRRETCCNVYIWPLQKAIENYTNRKDTHIK